MSDKKRRDPRGLAVDVLLAADTGGEFLHVALRRALDANRSLPRLDRAFLSRLAVGTVERMIELDYILNRFSDTKVSKMKPAIRAILRSAVYQLKYMDSVPASAAVSEAVKLAGRRGFSGLRGFVNAVLRAVSEKMEEIPYPSPDTEPIRALSVRYSAPEWLASRFARAYGQERCAGILEAYLKDRQTCVRVDINKKSPDEVRLSLEQQGIRVVSRGQIPYAFYIDGYDRLDEIPEFAEGILYAQDISSMMVAHLARPREGDFVLDVCAAPGGKSLHFAQLMRGEGMVEARDLTERKVGMIRENIRRCHAANMRVRVWDALVFDPEMEERADIVVADLPCSGLGVVGRRPDIKYNASEEGIRKLAGRQRRMLEVVRRYARPGGLLMYSTCTVTGEENQENTAWFLRENPEFFLEEECFFLPDEGRDGFYIAKLRRGQIGGQKRKGMGKRDIKSLPLRELECWVLEKGEKRFRAEQLYRWMHKKTVKSISDMGNVPVRLREEIAENATFTVLQKEACRISGRDGTRKYLFRLGDGNMVESVFMRYRHGNSVCVSSQVGCGMGCAFCASAADGLVRNLTPAEMLEQVYRIREDTGERVSNVVVMGTGEPLDNYENLLVFLRMLTDENGLRVSQRNVTVSTCGLVPRMRELAGEKLQVTLALSLHAPDQRVREALMPVAKSWDIRELIGACVYYFRETGRRVTLEYSLIAGINDSNRNAADLASLIDGICCHLNLIPINPIREKRYRKPSRKTVMDFKNTLEKNRINVTIRRELGNEIDAACGQLRKRIEERQGS